MAEFTTTIAGADPWGRMPSDPYYNDWGDPTGQIDWSQVGQNVISQSGGANMPGGSRAGGPFILTEPLGTGTTTWPGDWNQVNQNVAYPGTSYQASGLGYVPYQSESTDTSIYPNSTTGTGTANYNYGTANNNYSGGNMANQNLAGNLNYQNPTAGVQSPQTDFSTAPFSVQPWDMSMNFGQQVSEESSYLNNLTNFLQSQETTPNMYNRISGQLNLPSQRENMLEMNELGEQLYSQIYGMPQNVALTSRESTVTAPQMQRVIESRQAPLQKSYEEFGRQRELAGARLTSAEEEASRRMQMEIDQQQKMLMPFEQQAEMLTERWSREVTGWSKVLESELDRLINNSEGGLNWNVEEKKRANELAELETRYKIAKLEADTDLEVAKENRKSTVAAAMKSSTSPYRT